MTATTWPRVLARASAINAVLPDQRDADPAETASVLQCGWAWRRNAPRAARILRRAMRNQQDGQGFRVGTVHFTMTHEAGFKQGRDALMQSDRWAKSEHARAGCELQEPIGNGDSREIPVIEKKGYNIDNRRGQRRQKPRIRFGSPSSIPTLTSLKRPDSRMTSAWAISGRAASGKTVDP